MKKDKEKLEQIKENIRTINPIFTDEVLDLLYEYATHRHVIGFEETLKRVHGENYFSLYSSDN